MKPNKFNKISKSPEAFFNAIPTGIEENIDFRGDLHTYLVKDQQAKSQFLALCYLDPCIFFNTSLWCPNPRGKTGLRNVPFILRPHQNKAVREIKHCIDNSEDADIDKSRDEGATFILCGIDILYFILQKQFTVLLGSRIEPLVDTSSEIINGNVVGNELTLFYKLLYLLNSLPLYLQPKFRKTHMFLQNLENQSAFSGQATSIGFGKGSRATVIEVDELAAIEPKIAQAIIENIADVSGCCIFNSTQGDWGEAHPYAKMLLDKRVKTIILDWTDNPEKNRGLYKSPEAGIIQIKDIDYYRQQYSGRFDNIESMQKVNVNNIQGTYPFVADGGVSNYNCYRSIWFDKEELRPGRTKRGVAQNILRIPFGSSDTFFPFDLTEKLRDKTREPDYRGSIEYSLGQDGYIREPYFIPGGKNSIFCWWGDLINVRPDQNHNYVVGVDLSKGTGTSNSVAAVGDVNTNEIVGMIVTPYLSIPDFAELTVALCEWVGGNVPPLLIWEENGAPEFLKRVNELGYYSLYIKEDKEGHKLKSKTKHGWRSTGGPNGTKIAVLNALESALYEGLREDSRFTPLKLYDEQTVNELASYVYFEGKIDVGPVMLQTETSGAKAAHGDRGIAVGLCNEGSKQQTKGKVINATFIVPGSWAARRQLKEQKDAKRKENSKVWWE